MLDFEYTVMRSSRRSLGITVRDGRVIVRVPMRFSNESLCRFLGEHSDWIQKKLAGQEQSRQRFASVKEYRTVLICGTEKKLLLGAAKNSESADTVCLKEIAYLRKWLEKNYSACIEEDVYRLGKKIGVMPEDLQVRDFKAKWGSCDSRGLIKINWRILFLRPPLREYILVHELCHLKFLNHSADFWAEVEQFCPSYRKLRKELKDMAFLTELYR